MARIKNSDQLNLFGSDKRDGGRDDPVTDRLPKLQKFDWIFRVTSLFLTIPIYDPHVSEIQTQRQVFQSCQTRQDESGDEIEAEGDRDDSQSFRQVPFQKPRDRDQRPR